MASEKRHGRAWWLLLLLLLLGWWWWHRKPSSQGGGGTIAGFFATGWDDPNMTRLAPATIAQLNMTPFWGDQGIWEGGLYDAWAKRYSTGRDTAPVLTAIRNAMAGAG